MFFFRLIYILFFVSFSFSLFGEDFNFKKISFYGLTSVSEDFLLKKIVSDDCRYNCSEKNFLKKLSDLELFDKIDIYWSNEELKVFLLEKPLIKSVKLYTDSDKSYLLSVIDNIELSRGNFYDRSKIDKFRSQVEAFLISGGFSNFDVDISITYDSAKYVCIYLHVFKGFAQKIRNVDIIGVSAFSKKKLMSLLTYSRTNWMSWFLRDNIFIPEVIENNINVLKAYYLDRGYPDVQIDFVRFFISEDSKHVDILLSIFEGEKYSVWDIKLIGDKSIFPNEKMYNDFSDILFSSLKENDSFSRQKLMEIRFKLKEFLLRVGFLNAEVIFIVSNSGEARIKVDFIFNKFVRSRVKHINFIGNFLTCDHVLRRMIPVMEGANLSIDDIEFGKDEIIRNGISDFINVEYIKNPDDIHEMNVVYFIDEQKFGRFTAGLSYGNDEGFNVNLNIELANFLGIGSDLFLDFNHNGLESDFAFTYYTPYFFGETFGVGYRLYYRSDFFDQDSDDFDMLSETFGAYLYYSFEFDKFERLIFGIGCDMTFLGLYDEYVSNEIRSFIDKFGYDFKDYYFNFAWTYNSLDKFSYPTAGSYNGITFRLNIPGSKSKYYTLTYDFNYYNNFYNDYVLNIFSSVYYGNVYGNEDIFPFFKNFHIRSPNNIRGFKDRFLGPQDSNEDSIGGNLLLCAKFSLYVPNPFFYESKDIKLAIFFDIGHVYDTFSSLNKNFKNKVSYYLGSLKSSVGIAFLWNTPFGLPLEVSLAYPFNVDDDDSKSIFSISLG